MKTCCEVGGDRVLLGGLEMAKDGLEDSVVEKLLNAILVVKDDQPEKYGMILKDRVEDLKCVAERSEDIRSMVGCILQGLGLGLE